MARPFSEIELETILGNLRRVGRERDALLLAMGRCLTFRISKLLLVRVGDMADEGGARVEFVVSRRNLQVSKGVGCLPVCNQRVAVSETRLNAYRRRSLANGH